LIWLLAIPQQSQLFGGKGSQFFRIPEANAAEKLDQNLFDWVQNDNRRFLHVVYSVGDLDKTIKYVLLVVQFLKYTHLASISINSLLK
jgi:lactoylglutathione lyase